MARGTGYRMLRWLETRCAARHLRVGSRRRQQLLRKVGCLSVAAAGHRLHSGAWRAHGEAAYRRFKWDPAQVPADARTLCAQLVALEARLSALARQLGAGADRTPTRHPPASAGGPALRAGGTL